MSTPIMFNVKCTRTDTGEAFIYQATIKIQWNLQYYDSKERLKQVFSKVPKEYDSLSESFKARQTKEKYEQLFVDVRYEIQKQIPAVDAEIIYDIDRMQTATRLCKTMIDLIKSCEKLKD